MWPLSAYRDFKKKREQDAKARERSKVIDRLNRSIDEDNIHMQGSAICDLCRFAKDADMPGIAAGFVDKIEAKQGLKAAIHISIYLMNCMDSKEVQSAVAEKTFLLTAKVDRADEKEMAGVAMAANLIAFNADEGSDQRERGMALWREAVGTLSKTRLGVDFAFAAASNAALGGLNHRGILPHPLRGEAIDIWYKNVTELAKIDIAAATEEAKRIAQNYTDDGIWGPTAKPFTAKATEALRKFSLGN